MQCPRCSSSRHRAGATNGLVPDQIVRRRSCLDCGYAWFTVEVAVPHEAVGWSAVHHQKPVLRELVMVAAAATPMGQPGRPVSVKDCDSPVA